MQKLKEIFTRTCCRNFDSTKTISKEELNLIMQAGQAAPSAKN
jgi:nitroreductase